MALRFLNSGYFAGKVGIGNVSPGTKLHVGTGSGATVDTGYQMVIDSAGIAGLQILSATNQSGRIVFGDSGDNDIGMIKYDHTDNSMGFRTNGSGSERMRISSTGNVGIGTTSPGAKLDVQGTQGQLFSVTDDLSGEIFAVADISGVPIMTVNSSGVSYFDGNVGIGTNSPVAKLVVDSSTSPQILFEDNSGLTQNASITFDQGSQNTLTLATGYNSPTDLNRINIAPAGNVGLTVRGGTGGSGLGQPLVGIGTTSPERKLHINSGATNEAVRIESTDTEVALELKDSTGTAVIRSRGDFRFDGSSGEIMRMEAGGNVGIGTTSPAAGLQVALGSTTIPTAGASTASAVFGNSTSDDNYGVAIGANSSGVGYISSQRTDGTATTYNLAIQSNGGFVGVGTDSPDAPLHVLNDSSANVLAKIRIQGDSTSGYGDIGMQSGYIRLFSNGSMCSAWTGGVQYNYINGSTATTLTSTGLGVGTTTPDFKLDVDGTFGVSDLPGNLTSTSALVRNETIGSQLMTNNDFATTSGYSGSYSIASGQLTKTSGGLAYQVVSGLVDGGTYLIKVDVASLAPSGITNIYLGGNNSDGLNAGLQEFYMVAGNSNDFVGFNNGYSGTTGSVFNSISLKLVTSTSDQIQTRQLGTGAFGPTPVGAYLPLSAGSGSPLTGDLWLDDNSGASPSLYLQNGSNNYWRLVNGSTGIFSLKEATSDRITILPGGNVGIGTTLPGAKLHVKEASGSTSQIRMSAASNEANYGYLTMLDNTVNTAKLTLGTTWGYNTPVDAMTIVNGTVGIGTDAPDAYYANANDLVVGTHTGSNGISILSATDQTGWLVFADSTAGGDNTRGAVAYNHDNNSMTLRVNNNPCLVITSVGDVEITDALLSNQENTDIDSAAAEMVAQVAHATYTAAFFDFVVKKGTNVRSGTVYACHDGDTTPLVEFTETSTQDLGDTSDVVLSVDISGANMRLLATVASDDWSVKSLIRAI